MSLSIEERRLLVNKFGRLRDKVDRTVDELIGLAKGMVADEKIHPKEAEFLEQWLICNQNCNDKWPVSIIYMRITEMMADRVLENHEQKELLKLLKAFSGGLEAINGYQNLSTALPLEDPLPDVIFVNRRFCFTGKCLSYERKDCHALSEVLGAKCSKDVRTDTDYVIIGWVGSSHWKHTSFGRKIETAVKYRDSGHPISIISEEHWVNALKTYNPEQTIWSQTPLGST